jgi:hypothetical protein
MKGRNRFGRRWRGWLLAASVLLASDLLAAQLLVWARPAIDVSSTEQDASEREYRVQSEIYDHDLAKSFDGTGWWGPLRYRMRTNSLGFKDATTRTVPLAPDRRRVLLIGDSFTEGLGFEYRNTYAGLIATQLDAGGEEVLNAAVTSYSPAIYHSKVRYLLEDVGLKFSELVVFIDISDIEDEARLYDLCPDGRVTRVIDAQRRGSGCGEHAGSAAGAEQIPTADSSRRVPQASQGRMVALRQSLRTHSILIRVMYLVKDRLRGQYTPSEPSAYPKGNSRRASWTFSDADLQEYGRAGLELADRHMDMLAALLREHDIPLTIAVYPWPDQVRSDRADSLQVVHWRTWADRSGARFIDLFKPFFRDADREATIRAYYIRGDVHFNSAGHRQIANSFLETYRALQR